MQVMDFLHKRKRYQNEYFPHPQGSSRTVLISSYVWWTELIAYAMLRLGFNVLVAEPWYLTWLSDERLAQRQLKFDQWVKAIRDFKVQLVIGGNTTCIMPHPITGELVQNAAGVPLVNYWWDEPRAMSPLVKNGMTPEKYIEALRDSRTLNVVWDADVEEEMQLFLNIQNTIHVPLATTPQLWATQNVPLAGRTVDCCFLGNNHDEGNWIEQTDPALLQWAERVAAAKLADLDKPMVQCVEAAGTPGGGPGYMLASPMSREFERWSIVGAVLIVKCRNAIVQAAGERLGKRLSIVGKGWERLGLTAEKEFSGIPTAKDHYVSAKASLNLFGGCVHGGMPLRPYEIAASNGLIFTQYNRELPALFELGNECVAFRDSGEMLNQLDRILSHPQDYDAIVQAGHRRACAEHTWERRMDKVLQSAKQRFDLPW